MSTIRIRDLSFGTKILLYGSGASLFSLVLAMAAILIYDSAEFRNAFIKRTSDRAELLSRSCASALVFKDPASAESALSDLEQQHDVIAACVYDEEGATFAQFAPEGGAYVFPNAPSAPSHVFREGRLDVFRPIQFRGDRVGMLHIRANPAELGIRFRRYLGISMAVLFVSFLGAVLLALSLKKTLIRPIQELVAVAETVSNNYDYTIQAKKFANDELGVLADAFNQMIKRVQLRKEERDNAEAELKHQLYLTKTITDNLPIFISQIDTDFKYIFANQYYYDVGELQESMIGQHVVDIIGEESFNRALPYMQKALSGEFVSFENRTTHTKNNELIILENNYIPHVVDGKVDSFFVLGMVITERKLAEEDLARTRALLNQTEKSGKIGGWRVDIETMSQTWTEETYRIHEVDMDFEPIVSEGINFYAPSSKPIIERAFKHTIETGQPYDLELELITAKGNRIWVHSIGKAQQLDGVTKVVSGSFQDITERKQIQEMIVAKNKEMENYLYITSHDLRTPLVNIQGFSQRLEKQADSIKSLFANQMLEPELLHQLGMITDEDIPKTLRFVLDNIEKMDALINGLLQLSRTGRVEMTIQKIDMNELVAKIRHRLDFQIKEAQCKIQINPLPECYGDAALLDQLFANLISNALKYADSERALAITVDAKKTTHRVLYTIRDTGQGFAQKHLEKIWDVFYRIDPRSGKAGEGIGLSLVKRIVEKHQGKVWAESQENSGSVFHIELHNRSFTEF